MTKSTRNNWKLSLLLVLMTETTERTRNDQIDWKRPQITGTVGRGRRESAIVRLRNCTFEQSDKKCNCTITLLKRAKLWDVQMCNSQPWNYPYTKLHVFLEVSCFRIGQQCVSFSSKLNNKGLSTLLCQLVKKLKNRETTNMSNVHYEINDKKLPFTWNKIERLPGRAFDYFHPLIFFHVNWK